MAKNNPTHLALVDERHREAVEKSFTDKQQREQEEEQCKLSRSEIKRRVKEIRVRLERFDNMIAGINFDIGHPDEPPSIRSRGSAMESNVLTERLIPLIRARFDRLERHLYDSYEFDLAENVLAEMKCMMADGAFAIGVLAGAIFTGADPRIIDRLERGLCHAISSRADAKD